MPVPVMDVRVMRMAVYQGLVAMRVGVRTLAAPGKGMGVLVVLVVVVHVVVLHGLVPMQVVVIFGQVQPHAQRHERRRRPKCGRRAFAKRAQGYGCAHERCR